MHKDLEKTSHMWLRDDAVRPPLVSPYSRPYRVIARRSHNFKIEKDGKEETVSIERYKPAYMDEGDLLMQTSMSRSYVEIRWLNCVL